MAAPFFQNQNPAPDATGVDPGTTIFVEVVDPEFGVNDLSVVLLLDGVDMWSSDAQQNGYTVVKNVVSGGFSYSITPPAPLSDGAKLVELNADDFDDPPNFGYDSFMFTVGSPATGDPPTISSIRPEPGEEGVALTKAISFTIGDDVMVDDAETLISVRDQLVYNGQTGLFAQGWTSSQKIMNSGANGYDFILAPDAAYQWEPGELVRVSVTAKDQEPLTTQREWFFEAEGAPFPFKLDRFVIKSIRDMDSRSPGLIELMMTLPDGFNDQWEQKVHDRAEALTDLLDPQKIPDQWLPWLKSIVGFTRDLSFQATEAELRKIIQNAVPYWKNKPTERALDFAIRMVTGNRFKLRNYFDFRMMAAEPGDVSEAVFVTELLEDFDPDVIDFPSESPSGDQLLLDFISTVSNGDFTISDLTPDRIFPGGKFVTKEQFIYLEITSFPFDPSLEGFHRIAFLTPESSIGRFADKTPFAAITGVQTASYRLWGPNSDFTTEVRLVDEPTGFAVVNRTLLKFLIEQIRPSSERVDLVYIAFLDQFITPRDLAQWTVTGTPTLPSPGGIVNLPTTSTMTPDKSFASSWFERSVIFKFSLDNVLSVIRLHAMFIDSDDSYLVEVSVTGQFVVLIKRAGGVDTTLDTVVVPEIESTRIDSVRVDIEDSAGDTFIRVKYSGDTVIEYTDTSDPHRSGSIQVQAFSNSSKLYLVEVMTLPVTVERVGPAV